jgi:hypothetical protein
MRIGAKLYHIRFEITLFVAQGSAAADLCAFRYAGNRENLTGKSACATTASPLEMHRPMNDNGTATGSLASK